MTNDSRLATHDSPLSGRRIVVTRPWAQAAEFIDLLKAKGAAVIVLPTIRIDPPDDVAALDEAIRAASSFDFIVFTSANGVGAVRERIEKLGFGAAFSGRAGVCTVGPATARAAERMGLEVSVLPEAQFNAEGLVASLKVPAVAGRRFQIFRAAEGRDVLPDELRKAGAETTVVAAYKTVKLTEVLPGVLGLLKERPADAITFTSPSTFKGLVKILGADADRILRNTALASIGPVTSAAIRDAGYKVAIEPKESTIPALVDAIGEFFSI
ncbi:MAG: uroporphyrinogen-III synthase [Deltaproteobacteria bacterium]|nr:uroporphyrinogen-III synthase [Deltaproteobacteria bacterium]